MTPLQEPYLGTSDNRQLVKFQIAILPMLSFNEATSCISLPKKISVIVGSFFIIRKALYAGSYPQSVARHQLHRKTVLMDIAFQPLSILHVHRVHGHRLVFLHKLRCYDHIAHSFMPIVAIAMTNPMFPLSNNHTQKHCRNDYRQCMGHSLFSQKECQYSHHHQKGVAYTGINIKSCQNACHKAYCDRKKRRFFYGRYFHRKMSSSSPK